MITKIGKTAGAALSALLVATLGACATAGTVGTSADSAESQDLTYVASFDPASFFWGLTNSWESGIIFGPIVDRLIYWPEGGGQLEPWLAESWDVNDDSSQFTLQIREGVTFSDGTELTPQVVADNLNIKGLGDTARGIAPVPTFPPGFQSAQVTDAGAVVVDFDRPAYGFLNALSFYHAGIVSAATLEQDFDALSQIDNIVGSGPFTFAEYKPAESYLLERREDYNWGPEGVDHQGPAKLDSILVQIATESNIRLGLLESGQADVLRDVPPADEQRLTSSGIDVLPAQQTATSIYLKIRPNTTATADLRVRQAIQHAVNRQELIDTLYFTELWSPATSVLERNVPGWIDLSEELFFDPDLANELLDEAGWQEKGADGIRVKDGERLSFEVFPVAHIQNSEPELLQISQQLQDVGIELSVRKVDTNQITTELAKPTTSVAINLGSVPQVAGPLNNVFHSQSYDPWFSSEGQHVNPDLDQLLETLSQAGNEEQYLNAVADVQTYLIGQAYVIPLDINLQTFAASAAVKGLEFDAYGRPFFYTTWLER